MSGVAEIRDVVTPSAAERSTRWLLVCGWLSSVWYATITAIIPRQWNEYRSAAQTISELSAIDAPTRDVWVILAIPYTLLIAAFGSGVLRTAHRPGRLRLAGVLIFASRAFGRIFCVYSLATIVVVLLFGAMTGFDSPDMQANRPTPFMGVWERISIGAFLLWIVALSATVLRGRSKESSA